MKSLISLTLCNLVTILYTDSRTQVQNVYKNTMYIQNICIKIWDCYMNQLTVFPLKGAFIYDLWEDIQLSSPTSITTYEQFNLKHPDIAKKNQTINVCMCVYIYTLSTTLEEPFTFFWYHFLRWKGLPCVKHYFHSFNYLVFFEHLPCAVLIVN